MEIKTPRRALSLETLALAARRASGRRIERREWTVVAAAAALSFSFLAGHWIGLPSGLVGFAVGVFAPQRIETTPTSATAPASMPRLQIDIKQNHYQRLEWKRDQALARGRIITTEDSYVPARITVGDRTVRVRMRLKGDLTDHLEGDKWSFRIKVRNGDSLLGMRRFSIQDPDRSGWIKEWVMHRWLSDEGLIGLRYRFVDVAINGEPMGVFALEESFGKELIEHRQRVDAPVLKFDEGLLLDKSRTNLGDNQNQTDIFFAADITSFETDRILADPRQKERFLAGRALLERLRRRELSVSEVLDVRRAARVFAIQEILAVHHGLRWKNVRFYFDPLARRLELIAYNAYGAGRQLHGVRKLLFQRWQEHDLGAYVHAWIDLFFSDPQFQREYWRELERLTAPGAFEAFFDEIEPEMRGELAALASDGGGRQPDLADYRRNRDAVRQMLSPRLPLRVAVESFDRERRILRLSITNRAFVPMRLSAIACGPAQDGIELDSDIAGRAFDQPAAPRIVEVAAFDSTFAECLDDVSRDGDLEFFDGLELHYALPGGVLPRTARIEASPRNPELTADPAQKANAASLIDLVARGVVKIDERAAVIRIQPGSWRLVADAVFPAGYTLLGGPATRLDLANGASVISFSPVSIVGSAAEPFWIESIDATGQGLVVVQAASESRLRHVRVIDQAALDRPGWTLTGAVTFYESDVRIEDSHFATSRSEDLVNLVRSNYAIEDSTFSGSRSDALDVDFGDGSIDHSGFEQCGNDCIDVSQSATRITHLVVDGAGDKGVSVGERSRVHLRDARIDHAAIAVASKDASHLDIASLRVSHSATGIAAYRKKPEFAGGSVTARDVAWTAVEAKVRRDRESQVTIDDRRVTGAPWTATP